MTSKVVGEGTFGCVLKPPLLCDDAGVGVLTKKDYNNKISKIMHKSDAINEESEYSSINNIVGLEKYAIVGPHLCKPLMDNRFNNSVKNCKTKLVKATFAKNKNDLLMLLLEDGGINILDYIIEVYPIETLNAKKVFLTSLLGLFDGLLFFQANKIIHRDIKMQNMVYNVNIGKAKYIDFGQMTNFKNFIRKCNNNTETLGVSHSYYASENSCSNKAAFNSNRPKCMAIKDHFKTHSEFTSYVTKSFDIYCLSLALSKLADYLRFKKPDKLFFTKIYKKPGTINPDFFKEFGILLYYYYHNDVTKRNINIVELKENYTSLLKKYNYYSKTSEEPSVEVKEVIEKIKKKEIKVDLAKVCPPAKPVLNSATNRCVAECKPGFIRNKSFRCVKMNLRGTQKKPSSGSSITKRRLCESKNKDYNHITKRCNAKCPKNKTRNAQFKCV
jgi:serine/threonine protein kinase